MSSTSVLQECQVRSVTQECQVGSVKQKCLTRVLRNSVKQRCLFSSSHACRHSGSWASSCCKVLFHNKFWCSGTMWYCLKLGLCRSLRSAYLWVPRKWRLWMGFGWALDGLWMGFGWALDGLNGATPKLTMLATLQKVGTAKGLDFVTVSSLSSMNSDWIRDGKSEQLYHHFEVVTSSCAEKFCAIQSCEVKRCFELKPARS